MIISDNGGEFNNTLFTDKTEQFNINVKLTAAEFPWSKGVVKNHNPLSQKLTETLTLEHKNKCLSFTASK